MCENCDFENYLEKIDDLMAIQHNDFLQSVYEWIEENNHVTDNQKNAIDNMYN